MGDQQTDLSTDSPKAGPSTPPWAWVLIGVLAAVLICGAVWIAYSTGFSAGRRAVDATEESTGTQAAQAVTTTVAPDEPVDAGTSDPVADKPTTPGGSGSQPSEPPGGSSGGSSGTQQYDLSVIKPLDLQPIAPKVPTTWKVIFKHSNTGPWQMPNPPGAPLSAGYLRMTVLATDNASESGYVQLKRVDGGAQLANNGILYYWPAGSGSVIYKVTDPVLVEAGVYQLRASIHGPWTIMLEK